MKSEIRNPTPRSYSPQAFANADTLTPIMRSTARKRRERGEFLSVLIQPVQNKTGKCENIMPQLGGLKESLCIPVECRPYPVSNEARRLRQGKDDLMLRCPFFEASSRRFEEASSRRGEPAGRPAAPAPPRYTGIRRQNPKENACQV